MARKAPEKARGLAALDNGARKVVLTREAYAWALHVNGRSKEEQLQYEAIKAIGTRDAKILARAAKVSPESAGR